MRRFALLVLALLLTVPAAATASDLDDMLETGANASFDGVGVVMCSWGAESVAATYEITRRDGMSMVHGPEGDLMLSGAFSASWSDAGSSALQLGGWGEWQVSDRYDVAEAPVERLGRPATEVTIREGSLVRARVIVDDVSMVPLLTEVFTAAGTPYRTATLVEFTPGGEPMPVPEEMPDHDMLMPADPSPWLPSSTTGYRRVDTYEMASTSQAYYSDGLFSFSVFETDRGPMPDRFRRATVFAIDGHLYRRIVTPTVVWIQWDAPDRSYVLVGDLPPDHLEAVLTDLPDPGRRALVVRLWRRLFG